MPLTNKNAEIPWEYLRFFEIFYEPKCSQSHPIYYFSNRMKSKLYKTAVCLLYRDNRECITKPYWDKTPIFKQKFDFIPKTFTTVV